MVFLLTLLIIHIIFGILGYAFTLAYFQKEFPMFAERDYIRNVKIGVEVGLFGLLGLLSAIAGCRTLKHGLKFK